MLDKESMAETVDALKTLTKLVTCNEISASAATLLVAANDIEQRNILPDKEEVGGIVLVFVGADRGVDMILEGAFLPELALGALTRAQLEIFARGQRAALEAPIQSMIADAIAAGAQIQKDVTKPEEH